MTAKQATQETEMTPVRQAAGTVAREDVTSRELAITAEIQAVAAAAQVNAEVQARYAMAIKRPRNVGQVRATLLDDCKRPRFAEVARYALPRGKCKECRGARGGCAECDGTGKNLVRGWTIRFAEAAMRALTNVYVRHAVVFDNERKRTVAVGVLDLECNTTYSADVIFEKTVERRFVDKAQKVVSQRINSYGEPVFIVEATDEEVAVKQAALVSRAIRTLLLRIVPGDLLDEALDTVAATQEAGEKAEDPTAQRKKIEDAFGKLGVTPVMLAEHLGHPVEACSPGERKMLLGIHAAIKSGETTWAQVIREDASAPPPPAAPTKPAKSVDELKAEARAKQAASGPSGNEARAREMPSPTAAPVGGSGAAPPKKPTTLRDRIAALEVKLGSQDLPSALFDALAAGRETRDEGLTTSFIALTKGRWPEALLNELALAHGFETDEGPTCEQLVAMGEALPAPMEKSAQ